MRATRAGVLGLALASLAAVACWLSPGSAQAHALLRRAEPQPGSNVRQMPADVYLLFSEQLDGTFSRIRVTNAQQEIVDNRDSHLDPTDPRALLVTLPPGLPDDIYTVTWRAFSAVDGHPEEGAYRFGVGSAQLDTAGMLPGTSRAVFVVETAVARWWTYVAASVVLGALVSWFLVLSPSLPSASQTLAVRASRRASRVATFGALGLVAATLYAAVAQASAAAGAPIWDVTTNAIEGTLLRGWYATIWWPRLVLAVFICALLLWRGMRGSVADLALAATPAVLLSSSLTGHAAAAPDGAALAVLLDWLHFQSVAVWLGGLAMLVALLPLLRTEGSVLGSVLRRFSRVALAAVVVIAVSGALQARIQVASWAALVESGYGWSVLGKVSLMLLMVLIGAWTSVRLTSDKDHPAVGARVWRSLRVELVLGCGVLALAAVLTGLVPTRG